VNRKTLAIIANLIITLAMGGAELASDQTIKSDTFYRLHRVAVSEQGIFLLDQGRKTVDHYSLAGEYLESMGAEGQGPGEFVEPQNLLITGDTLWVLGHTMRRIVKFVDGQFAGAIQMQSMPISFSRIGTDFIVGHVFTPTFLIKYNHQGQPLDSSRHQGASRKKFKNSPFPIFSALTHMTASRSHFYLTYEYKNAVEKYSPELRLKKSAKIAKRLKEPQVKDGGNNQWYIDGDAIAKDIKYSVGKVYVLWMAQIEQVECEGLSRISIFDENLKAIAEMDLPDCVVGFDVFRGKLYGVCNEPEPRVVVYHLE